MLQKMPFEIRTLAKSEKISEPGFYNIPMSQHHGQPCIGPSVTSSVLRKLELETPADVWAFHDLNPDRYENEERDALRLGRAMAALVEGGAEELERNFYVLPNDKPRKPTEAQIKAYKEGKPTEAGIKSVEFWARVDKDPRGVLSEAEWDLICQMGKALGNDPAACAALGGLPEITMAFFDEATQLWCLSRPDQISFDGLVSDYKKVNTQGAAFNHKLVDRRITAMAYDMQIAFAAEAFEILTGHYPDQAGLVFQCDKPPYSVILRPIEHEDLQIASFRNREARHLFRSCLDSGDWWGPGMDIGSYQRPQWQREQLLERMNIAGVAP